jgi:uncharacterized membrane protein YhiD involved in acid resistance
MDIIDKIIVTWFNNGFSNTPSGNQQAQIWGNIALVLLSLVASALLSGVIGFEREYHGHSAGLRTHILVAVGSCLVMIISLYGFGYWDSLYTAQQGVSGSSRDPARLAAQVVTGIGFLGAGTIVQTGTDVKGLTTATTIWVSMALGLACGSGSFVVAIIATIVAFVALVSMRKVEKLASRKNPVIMIVCPERQTGSQRHHSHRQPLQHLHPRQPERARFLPGEQRPPFDFPVHLRFGQFPNRLRR